MDQRTKILAAGFGLVVAYVVVSRLVYPTWIRPLLTLDERIAERKEDLAELEELQRQVDEARFEYRNLVARVGSFDPGRVETEIRDRINALIEKHSLQDSAVAPSRPLEDRKTGITTTLVTVSGVGPLGSALGFLKDVSELPQLIRVGNPVLYPAGGGAGRKGKEKDLVNLRVPIEIMVLPQNKVVGHIKPADLRASESFVRHAGRDYSEIARRTPFQEYVEYPPLRVDTQRTVSVEVGQQAVLQVNPSGGDGNYSVLWSPPDGLGSPDTARTPVDTSEIGTRTYTVTVTDTAESKPASATVTVAVREKKTEPAPTPTELPPPREPVVRRWPQSKNMQVVMSLLRTSGSDRNNELMVFNNATKETTYHAVGQEFDGGTLVYVHQTGGLVHRMKQFYVYPLGEGLDNHVEALQAHDHPELKAAAERAVASLQAKAQADAGKAASAPQGPGIPAVEEAAGSGAGVPELAALSGEGPLFPHPAAASPEHAVEGPPGPEPTGSQPRVTEPGKRPAPTRTPQKPVPTRPRPKKSGRL